MKTAQEFLDKIPQGNFDADYLIEFAKLHVEAALKAAKAFEVDGCGCGEATIISEHINNCYSLENIK